MTTTEIAPVGAASPQHIPYRPPRPVRYGATAGLLVLLIAFPQVFPNPTVTSIGVFTMIYLIAAIGWNIFSGYSGYISIGHAAYYGIGQYTVALITIHAHLGGGWGLFGLLPVAGLVAALASIPIGFLLLRVRKHTFIVLTIAVMFIFQLLAFNLTTFTNGSGGLTLPFPTWTGDFFNMPFYYVGLLAAVVAGAVAWWVRRSKYGLGLFAIRDDEERARGLGIKVTRTKLIAYAASAFFVGIAGGLYAPFVGSVYPQFAFDPTFDLAIAVLVFVGGIGTLSGPVLGALVLIPLQQYFYLQFGNANLYLIAYGVLFILILRLLPGGIVPGVTSAWRSRLVARARARQEDTGQEDAGPEDARPDAGPEDTGPEDARPDPGQKDRA
jgi:branched-chain amino acid transport system permease protein